MDRNSEIALASPSFSRAGLCTPADSTPHRLSLALKTLWTYWRVSLKKLPGLLGLERSSGRLWRLAQGKEVFDHEETAAVLTALARTLGIVESDALGWAAGIRDMPVVTAFLAAKIIHPVARDMAAIRLFMEACSRAGTSRLTLATAPLIELMPEGMRDAYLDALYPSGSQGGSESREALIAMAAEARWRFYLRPIRQETVWRLILPCSVVNMAWQGSWPFAAVSETDRSEFLEQLLFDGVHAGRISLFLIEDSRLPDRHELRESEEISVIGADTSIRRPLHTQIRMVYDTMKGADAADVVAADKSILTALLDEAKPVVSGVASSPDLSRLAARLYRSATGVRP